MLENIEKKIDVSYNKRWKKSYQKLLAKLTSMTYEEDEPMLDIARDMRKLNSAFNAWHQNKTEEERVKIVIETRQSESQQTSIGGN
jgi:hypothetical protein